MPFILLSFPPDLTVLGRPDLDLGGMDFSVIPTSHIYSTNFNFVDHGLMYILFPEFW